jgi:hypothetical protein
VKSSIVAQGAQRIDAHGAEGWDGTSRHTHQHQSDRGGEESERISRANAKQLPSEQAAHREVSRDSDCQASGRRFLTILKTGVTGIRLARFTKAVKLPLEILICRSVPEAITSYLTIGFLF